MAKAPEPPGGYPQKTGATALTQTEADLAAERSAMDPTQLATAAFASDGAVTTISGSKILTKTSAGAYTLAAPVAGASAAGGDDGTQLIITAGTAFAHVITATGLIHDGVTGGAKGTLTFGAFVGSSIHLIAYNAKWHVVAKNVVTIT